MSRAGLPFLGLILEIMTQTLHTSHPHDHLPSLEQITSGRCNPVNNWCAINQEAAWGENIPSPRAGHSAAVYRRSNSSTALQRMVVFGGDVRGASSYDTWTYVPWTGEWMDITKAPRPKARFGHTMTTVCDTRVVLVGGGNYFVDEAKTFFDVWLFEGETETWNKIRTTQSSSSPPGAKFQSLFFHTAVPTVPPRGRASRCRCSKSILIFGGVHNFFPPWRSQLPAWLTRAGRRPPVVMSDLWELRCVDDRFSHNTTYEWIRIVTPRPTPDGRWYHSAALVGETMYVIGGLKSLFDRDDFWNEVWAFNTSNSQWTLLKENPPRLAMREVKAVHIKGTDFIVIIAGRGKIFLFHTKTVKWTESVLVTNNYPDRYVSCSAVVMDEKVVVFGGGSLSVLAHSNDVWNLTYVRTMAGLRWVWQLNRQVPSHPDLVFRDVSYFHYDEAQKKSKLFVFGGRYLGNASTPTPYKRDLWIMEYQRVKLRWWMYRCDVSPPALVAPQWSLARVVRDTDDFYLLVLFGGKTVDEKGGKPVYGFYDKTWALNLNETTWTMLNDGGFRPRGRHSHSMVTLQNGSVLLFGGWIRKYSNDADNQMNDLWLLTLKQIGSECMAVWTQLAPYHGRGSSLYPYPEPRSSHKAFIWKNTMYVYGGSSHSDSSFWSYDVPTRRWSRVKIRAGDPDPSAFSNNTISNAIVFGDRAYFVFLSQKEAWRCPGPSKYNFSVPYSSAWTFSMSDVIWSRLSNIPLNLYVQSTFWFNNSFMMLGYKRPVCRKADVGNELYLTQLQPGCRAGYFSRDYATNRCKSCPKGTYSAVGSSTCQTCPLGMTTTRSANSATEMACTCEANYCHMGTCFVMYSSNNRTLTPLCKCHFGYTGNTCRYPTYYLIGLGVVCFLVVIALMLLFIQRTTKKSKQLTNTQQQLLELTDVWEVDPSELEMGPRIDVDSPGSYGEVRQATYRDWIVAVKKLKHVCYRSHHRFALEFEREVRLMRAIRHPNIVMFLGAGRMSGSGRPFLVMEYLHRGALGSVLRNESISLTTRRKMQFAIDAAKGMNFLHGLRPARIHRDLKSNNLLLSDGWIVKVADFGQARLVKEEKQIQVAVLGRRRSQKRKRNRHGKTESEETAPLLLNPDRELTVNIGTLLWRSPELFQERAYGTSTDVYRLVRRTLEGWRNALEEIRKYIQGISPGGVEGAKLISFV